MCDDVRLKTECSAETFKGLPVKFKCFKILQVSDVLAEYRLVPFPQAEAIDQFRTRGKNSFRSQVEPDGTGNISS